MGAPGRTAGESHILYLLNYEFSFQPMWAVLWRLARGETLPEGHGELRVRRGQVLRVAEQFLRDKIPTRVSPEPPKLHFAHLPLKLEGLKISICSDRSTEEDYELMAVGFLIAARWQRSLEDSRRQDLTREQSSSRNWVRQRVLGLASFSPCSFPPGCVGKKEGDWMVS